MENQPIIDNDYTTLVYHPEEEIVHHTFHRPIGGAEFREVLEAGIELLKEHNAHKWLSDDRSNASMSEEDTAWALEEWFPQATAFGWDVWAIIVPAGTDARVNYSQFVFDAAQKGVRISLFNNVEEAMAWLAEL